MLTDDFPFLLPRRIENDLPAKLRTLAADLERIRTGDAPTADELAAAPAIRNWRVALTTAGLRLAGSVSGHPSLGDCFALTTQIWAADESGRWVRTLSRFYKLDEAAQDRSHQSTDPDDFDILDEVLRDV
jgi:hypothetical protein